MSTRLLPSVFRRRTLLMTGAAALWLLLWQAAALLLRQPLLLSSPLTVLDRAGRLFADGSVFRVLTFSLPRLLLGYGVGFVLGVLLSVLSAKSELLRVFLHPMMLCIRAVPVASFIILALVWLGAKRLSGFIALLLTLPIVYNHLLAGLLSENRALREMAGVYGIPPLRRLVYIELPRLRPHLVSAVSLSAGMAVKAAVAAEVIGIPQGSLGDMLYQAKVHLDMSALYAWTLIIVFVSLLLERGLLLLVRAIYARLEAL